MDELRTRHATSGQVHELWSALSNMRQQIEKLTERLNTVEVGTGSRDAKPTEPLQRGE